MQKAHERINWKDFPSKDTAVNAKNLNKMDGALDEVDNRTITLDLTKFDKVSASGLMTDFEINLETGDVTLTYYSGSKKTFHTNFAKIALNITWDSANERLVLHMPDGSKTYVDLSTIITQFEFLESDEIYFEISADGKVRAHLKDYSIGEKKLRPNFLADIKTQAEIATKQAEEAATAKNLATTEADRAKVEADKAAQYSNIVAPDFYVDVDTMTLCMKEGVGVDFIVVDNVIYWKVA